MPYWTKTLSAHHPSSQSAESFSNAHLSLMNVINLNADRLWTLLKAYLLLKTCSWCSHGGPSSAFMSRHSLSTEDFICQRQDNNKVGPQLLKQTFKEILPWQNELKRQESVEMGIWAKKPYNDDRKREETFPVQSVAIWTYKLLFSSYPAHLHLFYVPTSYYAEVYAKNAVWSAKWISLCFSTFLINSSQGRRVRWYSVAFMLTRIFEPFSLNRSYLGNQPAGVTVLYSNYNQQP